MRDSAGIRLVELPGDDASAPHWSYELDGAWMAAARGTGRDAAGERSPQAAPAVEFGVDGLSALVVTDSSSWVPDLVSQRLTEFRPDGTVLRILPFPAVGEADGGAYFVQWRAHPERGFAFRRLARDGDRIMHWPERGAAEVVHRFGSLSVPFNTLLPPTPIWDLTGEGSLVTARSDRPTVTLRLPASAGSEFGQPIAALGPEALRVGTSTGFGSANWDVLDQEGFLVARATFPEGFDPRRFTERWIYGIMTDSLGEQTPARVERVRPPDSP